jgi:hypothetical protein
MRLVSKLTERHIVRRLGLPALVAVSIVALASCNATDVTRPRLEHALAPTFANLYVQQAAILGHGGVTAESVGARASCDRGGPKVADAGPGADWICMIHFTDETRTAQDGKFELQVKSNSCFTAAGPSKSIGLATISDSRGADVTNPVFEFDGCFDPDS